MKFITRYHKPVVLLFSLRKTVLRKWLDCAGISSGINSKCGMNILFSVEALPKKHRKFQICTVGRKTRWFISIQNHSHSSKITQETSRAPHRSPDYRILRWQFKKNLWSTCYLKIKLTQCFQPWIRWHVKETRKFLLNQKKWTCSLIDACSHPYQKDSSYRKREFGRELQPKKFSSFCAQGTKNRFEVRQEA